MQQTKYRMPRLWKGMRFYYKLRYRKGHGVHSPFTYNLITKVIEEKFPYYVFEEIESFRTQILERKDSYSQITAQKTHHRKYGQLLFRLVNFFNCENVLQIGASTGIMTLYLASALPACQCVVLEEDKDLKRFTEELIKQARLKNVRIETGDYLLESDELAKKLFGFDLIFINTPNNELCKTIIDTCFFAKKDIIVIINGINKIRSIKVLWQQLKKKSNVNVLIDLDVFGIIFFKENINKQYYKIYMNDAKRPIFRRKKGRRRFFVEKTKGYLNLRIFNRLINRRLGGFLG